MICKLSLTSSRLYRWLQVPPPLRTLISYQLGHVAPPLMVTGFIGACRSLTLAPWKTGDALWLKKSKKPADESPKPCSQIRENHDLSVVTKMDLSILLGIVFKAFCISCLTIKQQFKSKSKFDLMSYKTIKVQELEGGTIIKITLHRPKVLNAINWTLCEEVGGLMKSLNTHETARVVVIEGDGKLFTSGIDLKDMTAIFTQAGGQDPARKAIGLQKKIKQLQQQLLNIYECRLPVIVGIHRLCIGAGIDFVSGVDIRYCTKDCVFGIREIQLGVATDLGALQFLPKFINNNSALRELFYTGRDFGAEQALRYGFVNKVFQTQSEMQQAVLQTARSIASKTPVGIYTIKSTIKHSEKDVYDNFDFIKQINSVMLQTSDTFEAFSAYLEKRQPVFPKL